ncbi:MAG: protein-(glutamine-N(5)) methyltransferase [Sodalis sp. Fle]|nr:MAG: protein-(glutamine-N(5)) methyltransferase [Sodalis sp. Fle]
MTWQQWIMQASIRLCHNASAKRDAEILLGKVTSTSRTRLLAFGETPLDDNQYRQLESLLLRRESGEPIAYLTGEREFWSLNFRVSTDTLIPRPDTECLVEQALGLLSTPCAQALDLGTGTGAIALALASERPDWRITGVDSQKAAIVLAHNNAYHLGLNNNVQFLCGNWFKPLQGTSYDLIIGNPPYIDAYDPHLTQGDVRFEPKSALVAAHNGLADLIEICRDAGAHLRPGGWLILEHGWQQGEFMRALFTMAGFSFITTVRDYGDNERVIIGQWLS